ncbi:hypothetical protein ACSBR2_015839 [Camellia fascicularis]
MEYPMLHSPKPIPANLISFFLARFRKRTSSKMVIMLIWSAYSAADWSADFVVGLITNSVIRTSSSIPDEKGTRWGSRSRFLPLSISYTYHLLETSSGFQPYLCYLRELSSVWSVYVLCIGESPSSDGIIPEPQIVSKSNTSGLSNLAVLQYAFYFFDTFKGLFVDLIFSFCERNQSRDFFLERTPEEAFKVIEAELNLVFEVLYTKATALRCKFGYFMRFVSFSSVLVALVVFSLIEKQRYHKVDVTITYALLLGAMTLDIVSILMLISSDWSAVALKNSKNNFFVSDIIKKMVISRQSKLFEEKLRDFIFYELQLKSEIADDTETAKEICSARGDWVLRINNVTDFSPWITDIYEESLLLWHIATELCYNTDEGNNADNKNLRDISKLLSDYMLHLPVVRPEITSAMAGERSKSALFNTCMLAKELNKLGYERKWMIMSKVWVEMLSYAARRCRAYIHAQELSKGEELLTLVWLLMVHFGLGEQFQLFEDHPRPKLIVGK